MANNKIFFWVIMCFGAGCHASIVTYQEGVDGYLSTKDTFIDDSMPDVDNSEAQELEADSFPSMQILFRFDDIFGELGVGATINSATLTLNVSGPSVAAANIAFYQMLVPWFENDTWNTLGSGIQLDGFEAKPIPDFFDPNPEQAGVHVFDVTSTVTGWYTGGDNYGWVIDNDNNTPWEMYSSEEPATIFRPSLSIDYTPVPETVSWQLVFVGVLFARVSPFFGRRKKSGAV